ncbi:MAG: protein kinase, partial [Phycisphaerae bacterium]|nr:protein kinase [Phycisphaerae bacterium]
MVYRARSRDTGQIVALKLLLDGRLASERQRRRFRREIELAARLRHPNIVPVLDSGMVRGRHYYVMEFIEGVSISDYVLLNDLAPREIVGLLISVCHAIDYAHQHGVLHRDVN